MKRVVFCDFDGSITVEETFAGMMTHFAPELSSQLIPEMYALRLTLREGVRQILESIPSERYPEILDYVRSKQIRSGLVELLDFLEAEQVPFVVLSGGLRGMVETVLGDLVKRVYAIYAVDVDASNSYLRVTSEFEEGTELLSKGRIRSLYNAEEAVAIGDSLTDLNLALEVPMVFARDRLAQYLEERDKSYIPWNDFFDVRDRLVHHWTQTPIVEDRK